MHNPRLAHRYAKSLVDLAVEQNQLEAVYADMKYIKTACKGSRELTNLLHSPIIKADTKEKILNAVTENNVSALTKAFNTLLIKKGREVYLAEIAQAFIEQYNTKNGIHHVKLTTAVEVSDELKNSLVAKANAEAGLGKVELETKVDENLIGGFIVEFNNNLVDASVARDLREIKAQFSKNIYVSSIK